jgi:hypothetical protein
VDRSDGKQHKVGGRGAPLVAEAGGGGCRRQRWRHRSGGARGGGERRRRPAARTRRRPRSRRRRPSRSLRSSSPNPRFRFPSTDQFGRAFQKESNWGRDDNANSSTDSEFRWTVSKLHKATTFFLNESYHMRGNDHSFLPTLVILYHINTVLTLGGPLPGAEPLTLHGAKSERSEIDNESAQSLPSLWFLRHCRIAALRHLNHRHGESSQESLLLEFDKGHDHSPRSSVCVGVRV